LMMAASVFFIRSFSAIGFVLGICIALALNIVKVLWLRHSVTRATNEDQPLTSAYIGFQSLLRFAVTGLVIAAVHFLPFVDILGAIVGLLALPFANHVVHFFSGNYRVKNISDITSISNEEIKDETAK